MKLRWLNEEDLVTVNGKTRVTRVRGGVDVSRKSNDRAFPRMPLGKSRRVASPKGCDMASHAPDAGRTDHTRSRSNVGGEGLKQGVGSRPSIVQPVANPAPSLAFVLEGRVSGGKNNIGITREGRRFPNKAFVRWRSAAEPQMLEQLCNQQGAFAKPMRVAMTIHYYPGDLIRRDAPALIDALCHLLERCGVVEDDAQIKAVDWQEMELDRDNPRVELTLTAPSGRSRRGPEGGEDMRR